MLKISWWIIFGFKTLFLLNQTFETTLFKKNEVIFNVLINLLRKFHKNDIYNFINNIIFIKKMHFLSKIVIIIPFWWTQYNSFKRDPKYVLAIYIFNPKPYRHSGFKNIHYRLPLQGGANWRTSDLIWLLKTNNHQTFSEAPNF